MLQGWYKIIILICSALFAAKMAFYIKSEHFYFGLMSGRYCSRGLVVSAILLSHHVVKKKRKRLSPIHLISSK